MDTQVSEIVQTALANLSKAAEANTIIGKPIVTFGGATVLPISQVTFAFVAGGGEYGNAKRMAEKSNFAGGSGGGASLTPVGFLVIDQEGVHMLDAHPSGTVDKIFDVAKEVAEALKK